MELTTPIRKVKGVGEKTEGLLQNMGVYTVGDILLHFPRDYVKYPRAAEINELYDGAQAAVIVRIEKPAVMRRTRAMMITVFFAPEDYAAIEETLQPVYALTRGVTNKFLIKTIRNALDSCDSFFDWLPVDLRQKY